MFNGQMLFDRPMHVKIVRNLFCCLFVCVFIYLWDVNTGSVFMIFLLQDDKSLPGDDFRSVDKSPQLPSEYLCFGSLITNVRGSIRVGQLTRGMFDHAGGLGGIGMGLGPGGQPINANRLSGGGGGGGGGGMGSMGPGGTPLSTFFSEAFLFHFKTGISSSL